MHYQFLGTAYLPEGCLHESNPHPGLVRALDLARQTIQSPAGLKVFAEILHPLTYTQVSEHLDASLTSEHFPQICLHRDLENYWCHNHRFNQTPNKIWLLAEIVDALVAAWDAGNEIILNRNLVEVTVCILHELAHWIRWTKFKDTTTPPKLSFGNFGTDRGKYAGEVGWWLEYKLFGGPLRGARSIDNKLDHIIIEFGIYEYGRVSDEDIKHFCYDPATPNLLPFSVCVEQTQSHTCFRTSKVRSRHTKDRDLRCTGPDTDPRPSVDDYGNPISWRT